MRAPRFPYCYVLVLILLIAAVTWSAIKWLRDSMKMIKAANEIDALKRSVLSISGVYFVTAFSGLFGPYLDPGATGYSRPDVVYDAGAHRALHARRERIPDARGD